MRKPERIDCSRRWFVAAALPAIATLTPIGALAHVRVTASRSLKFHSLHTGERLETVYHADGRYLDGPLDKINWILRDWRTGQRGNIFRGVLDQLFWLGRALGGEAPFGVVSGFRSESTNRMLREASEGVARNSLHTYGMAIDVRRDGFAGERIWQTAVKLGLGGAGLYRGPNFVHLDVGPVRSWDG